MDTLCNDYLSAYVSLTRTAGEIGQIASTPDKLADSDPDSDFDSDSDFAVEPFSGVEIHMEMDMEWIFFLRMSTISVIKYTVTSLLHHLAAHIFVQIEEEVSALVALT